MGYSSYSCAYRSKEEAEILNNTSNGILSCTSLMKCCLLTQMFSQAPSSLTHSSWCGNHKSRFKYLHIPTVSAIIVGIILSLVSLKVFHSRNFLLENSYHCDTIKPIQNAFPFTFYLARGWAGDHEILSHGESRKRSINHIGKEACSHIKTNWAIPCTPRT